MGAVGDALGAMLGQDAGAQGGLMNDDLGSARAKTLDFTRSPGVANERLDRLINRDNYAPVTGVADAAARKVQSQLNDTIARTASSAPGGYDPAAQRGAMGAAARSSAQVADQAITGQLQEQMMNRQLGQGLDQVKLGLQNQAVNTDLRSAGTRAGLAAQQQGQSAQFGQNMMGTAFGVGSMLLSDKDKKKDIAPTDMEQRLDKLKPAEYRYKNQDGYEIGYRPDPSNPNAIQVQAPVGVHGDSPEFRQAVASGFPGLHAGTVQEQPTATEENAVAARPPAPAPVLPGGRVPPGGPVADPSMVAGQQEPSRMSAFDGYLNPERHLQSVDRLGGRIVGAVAPHWLQGEEVTVENPYGPNAGPAPKETGVMAQDAERANPQMVRETEAGKAIDVPKATGFSLAALGDLNDRLKRLEGKK